MTPNAAAGSGSRRGSVSVAMAPANDEAMMERAREHFSDGMLAPGTLRTKTAMRKTWASLCQARGMQVLPLTPTVMMEIAAIWKMAAFRSGAAYLMEIRSAHIRAGHPSSIDLDQALKDCKRSLQRGIGPPSKAANYVWSGYLTWSMWTSARRVGLLVIGWFGHWASGFCCVRRSWHAWHSTMMRSNLVK